MRVPGLKSLKLSARWLRSRFIGGALILGYHSIAEPESDAYSLYVTPQHFGQQLEVLSEMGLVISLRKLVGRLQEGRLLRRAVILTFDDGYADVLYHAKPLLERYQAPATIFVTTGALGRELWWDALERVLSASDTLPEQLFLQMRDGGCTWVPSNYTQRPTDSPSRDLVESIYRSLLPLPFDEREKAMSQIWSWVGSAPDDQPSRRVVTVDELLEIAACELIDIGAHTVTHPLLAGLPVPAQRSEIRESKVYLEEILGRPVASFSYPNGSSSRETLAIVRESGFGCACTSHNDVVWRGSDRFHLPRFWIPDCDGKEFSRWLRSWLSA